MPNSAVESKNLRVSRVTSVELPPQWTLHVSVEAPGLSGGSSVWATGSRLTFVSPLAGPVEDTAASAARMSSSVITEHGSMRAGVRPLAAAAAGATAAALPTGALVPAGFAATAAVGTALWLSGVGWDGCVAADVGALLTVSAPLLQPTTRLSVVPANVAQNRWRVRARGNSRILFEPLSCRAQPQTRRRSSVSLTVDGAGAQLKETREIPGSGVTAEATVTEECKAEVGVAADSVQTVLGDVCNFADGVGAQVGKVPGLQAAPDLLSAVEIMRVAGQRLDLQPGLLVHASAAM